MTDDNPFAPAGESESSNAATRGAVPLDLGAILQRCLDITLESPLLVVGALLIPVVLTLPFVGGGVALDIASEGLTPEESLPYQAVGFGLDLINFVISLFLQVGSMRIFWNLATGRPADLSMLLRGADRFLPLLAVTLIYVTAMLAGFCLLVVPAFIVGLGFGQAQYATVVRGLGPLEALQHSWEITDGHKVTLFLLGLVVFAIALALTCVTCGVGYLLAIPVLALVQAVTYQSLLAIAGQGDEVAG